MSTVSVPRRLMLHQRLRKFGGKQSKAGDVIRAFERVQRDAK